MIDERSAAFFAIGLAQYLDEPVALSCTSGTAVLNYAPAIAEAYYQKIPLLILTADRPPYLIDQGDGQTIRQKEIYRNYIRESYEIEERLTNQEEISAMINTALDQCLYPEPGPVHINLPFEEPLYRTVKEPDYLPTVQAGSIYPFPFTSEDQFEKLLTIWNKTDKKLIIAGMMKHDPDLQEQLSILSKREDVVIFAESTSNLNRISAINGIDKILATFKNDDADQFKPDLLLSMGGPVISKMVKSFLRKHPPSHHWHINPGTDFPDTYQCLTENIHARPDAFLRDLINRTGMSSGKYREKWWNRYHFVNRLQDQFISDLDTCDLKVYHTIFQYLPNDTSLHLANSTAVRYAQLFNNNSQLKNFANRGTSGIDGSVSTAMGYAVASGKNTVLITGDLAFFYDSNALLYNDIPGNLIIIIINNGGGGIFRFIPGPDTTEFLEPYFEARHNKTAEALAINAGIEYFNAKSVDELNKLLPWVFQKRKKPIIVEIFTPGKTNGRVLRNYFSYIKNNTQ